MQKYLCKNLWVKEGRGVIFGGGLTFGTVQYYRLSQKTFSSDLWGGATVTSRHGQVREAPY
jgi:hypothetical protein